VKGTAWQIFDEFRAVLGRRYPDFVYGGPLRVGEEVPVFVFHDIDPADLEDKLQYLKENGYATIGADEYAAWARSGGRIPPKSVLLTIDDGRASVRHCWYPLLERYDFRATVFLIPGYIHSRPRRSGRPGEPAGGEEERRTASDSGLLCWEEIEEMQRSGRLDFQSHTLYHHPVFQDDHPEGFFDPSSGEADWDRPLPAGYERFVLEGTIGDHAGFPLYRSTSMFLSMRRFLDNEEIRLAMVERVRALGGREFLASGGAGAAGALKRIYGELSAGRRRGRLQPPGETRREIRENLAASKEMIESRLGVPVRHLCYPYSLACPEVLEMAREVGYEAQYLGVDPARRTNRRGDDPARTVRLKHDYLKTLPGRGRLSLASVLTAKVRRRAAGERGV
jgi:peptidoglycan/xylan/chitin deacetylase (PgdA/CDA1 family)